MYLFCLCWQNWGIRVIGITLKLGPKFFAGLWTMLPIFNWSVALSHTTYWTSHKCACLMHDSLSFPIYLFFSHLLGWNLNRASQSIICSWRENTISYPRELSVACNPIAFTWEEDPLNLVTPQILNVLPSGIHWRTLTNHFVADGFSCILAFNICGF